MKNRPFFQTRPLFSWLKLTDIKAILHYMMKPNTLVKSKRAREYVSIEENSYIPFHFLAIHKMQVILCVHM